MNGLVLWLALASGGDAKFELAEGDRVVFVGGTFIEHEQEHGFIETLLTLQFKERNVAFRNMGWSGDEAGRQSRPGKQPRLEYYLDDFKPTVAFVSYGMMESMKGQAGLQGFIDAYGKMLDLLAGKGARIVMLSPIRHEDLGRPMPDPAEHNRNLKLYVDALAKLAADRKHLFVNLFEALPDSKGKNTLNGVHLNQEGFLQAALGVEKALGLAPAAWRKDFEAAGADNGVQQLRRAVIAKNKEFWYRYREQNYEYVYGSRISNQKGLPEELLDFEKIIKAREAEIAVRRGLSGAKPPTVPSQPNREGPSAGEDPEAERRTFTVADGFEVKLFASEPMIGKPTQTAWDTKNRLWVATTNVYPHIQPGEVPNDRVLILEDTDLDGRADKSTVFCDGLYMITGVLPGDGGAYVANDTRIYHYKDTNGDGKADRRDIVFSGVGTEDNHHSSHSFRWSPSGVIHWQQGIFLHTTFETAHGIVQHMKAGVFEYRPETGALTTYLARSGPPNPWGHTFHRWGHSFHMDSSGADGLQLILPAKGGASAHVSVQGKGKMAGGEIVSGRHLPEEWRGSFVTNIFKENKTVRFSWSDDGSGYALKEVGPLITSTSRSYRPVEIRMGPEGAIYIADWYNPLIGHMQHHLHDTGRDKGHGRIWRVTAKGRPLLPWPKFTGVQVAKVLDLLKAEEDYTRFQARRALDDLGAAAVTPALAAWVKGLDPKEPDFDHHRVEALWVYSTLNVVEPSLLKQVLNAKEPLARAAAVGILRRWIPQIPEALELLKARVADDHPRVRLEAVIALSYLSDVPQARALVSVALDKPMDKFLEQAIRISLEALGGAPPARKKK